MEHVLITADPASALKNLLQNSSLEVTPGDEKSIDAAPGLLPAGTEIFVAGLPKDPPEKVIAAAIRLHRLGMKVVPHIVARNIASEADLRKLIAGLAEVAGVERVLVLGGDRDKSVGPYSSGFEILRTGLLSIYGIKTVYLPCYPEQHPRISTEELVRAREQKHSLAIKHGHRVGFISQFCFESAPIISLARDLQKLDANAQYRVGVAGPTSSHTRLLKYALMCGVGASLRALRERQNLAKSVLSGETPEVLLQQIASARAEEPTLRIGGVHFFTFGSLISSAEFINRIIGRHL